MEILNIEKSKDYELIDTGGGEKLERYGSYVLCRPDTQAVWQKTLDSKTWSDVDAVFTHGKKSGRWAIKNNINTPWNIELNDIFFELKLLPSKHLGVFPEQIGNWKWLNDVIKKENRNLKVLNLFANTGGASLTSSKLNCDVVHVDSSDFVVKMAKRNYEINNLQKSNVRFIVDDVRKFVEREIKRGNKYDVVIMDPPVYGRSEKSVWRLEEDLIPFLNKIKKILSGSPVAILLNGYASHYSSVTYNEVLKSVTSDLVGENSHGELCILDNSGKKLSSGIFARWQK